MLRRILSAISFLSMLAICSAAQAQSKATVDLVMAHVKQGALVLKGETGRQHSIRSHQSWAKGQDQKRVYLSLVDNLLSAFSALTTRKELSKAELDSAMGYFKQASLLLRGEAGGQHSVKSHTNWAKGQSEETVRLSIAGHLAGMRAKAVQGLL